jgi:hypothetical protein
MKTFLLAALSSALMAPMSAAYAGGSTKIGIDPTVTSSRKMQDSSRGMTKPRDTVGTQPVQKPAGAGTHSGAPQRQGIESNGTDLQGTDPQATRR